MLYIDITTSRLQLLHAKTASCFWDISTVHTWTYLNCLAPLMFQWFSKLNGTIWSLCYHFCNGTMISMLVILNGGTIIIFMKCTISKLDYFYCLYCFTYNVLIGLTPCKCCNVLCLLCLFSSLSWKGKFLDKLVQVWTPELLCNDN